MGVPGNPPTARSSPRPSCSRSTPTAREFDAHGRRGRPRGRADPRSTARRSTRAAAASPATSARSRPRRGTLAVTGVRRERGADLAHRRRGGPPRRRRRGAGRRRLGPPAPADAHPHRAAHAVRGDLGRLRHPRHRRQHGAAQGPAGLPVPGDVGGPRAHASRSGSTRRSRRPHEIVVDFVPRALADADPALIRTSANLIPRRSTRCGSSTSSGSTGRPTAARTCCPPPRWARSA